MPVLREVFGDRAKTGIQQFEFRWPVAQEHRIDDLETPESPDNWIVAGGMQDQPLRWYCPLKETPGLFWDFAKLGERICVEEAHTTAVRRMVLAWVAKYGLLGVGPGVPVMVQSGSGTTLYRSSSETLDDFIAYAVRAHQLLSLWELVRANDTAGLVQRVKVVHQVGDHYGASVDGRAVLLTVPLQLTAKSPSLSPEQLETIALTHIFWVLWGHLRSVQPAIADIRAERFRERRVYKMTKAWYPADLLTCMMLQFYFYLTAGSERTGFCDECGEPFHLTRSDRKYCDSCLINNTPQNRYYQRKKRIEKLIEEGYSLEQITEREPEVQRATVERLFSEKERKGC